MNIFKFFKKKQPAPISCVANCILQDLDNFSDLIRESDFKVNGSYSLIIKNKNYKIRYFDTFFDDCLYEFWIEGIYRHSFNLQEKHLISDKLKKVDKYFNELEEKLLKEKDKNKLKELFPQCYK